MESFIRESTDETPAVYFDPEAPKFEMSGYSLPENVADFYKPLLDWLREYAKQPNDVTDMVFRMDYFNTASSKMIVDIMLILRSIKLSGQDVKVTWHYGRLDEDMKEAGSEYAEIAEVPITLVIEEDD